MEEAVGPLTPYSAATVLVVIYTGNVGILEPRQSEAAQRYVGLGR